MRPFILFEVAAIALSSMRALAAEPAMPPRAPAPETLAPTQAERDARLGWWREARFGMFVHWGVYSGLSGSWAGHQYGGYAEHIQRMAKIPIPTYLKEVAGKFNPTAFNADEWIRLAKEAGMGYFVITAKHHDGFAMFDSKASEHTIVKSTPFGRDPMPELRAACKKHGVKFGFYYSHAFDWGEENGPGNDWDFQNPGGDLLLHGADWWIKYPEFLPKARKYVDEKSIPQIQELIRKYDPDILWFDTPHKLPPEENLRILAAVRKAKPTLVVNGRIVSGLGDYESTCDRPAEFPPRNGDWEGVPTTNESYGYNANDRSHKPPSHFIQLLAKACARGGNTLMNIGPMGTGAIDEADVKILKGLAAWWSLNGESIRGTTRTPLPVQAWGESTRKGNRLYLHVFEWPLNGKLIVGGLKTKVKKAYLLQAPGVPLETVSDGLDLTLTVPNTAPDLADSVVALECAGEPQGDLTRLLSPSVSVNTLRGYDGNLKGRLHFGPGKRKDDVVLDWFKKEFAVVWPVRVNAKTTFDLGINYDAPNESTQSKTAEGDAGKEAVRAQKGAGGVYCVQVGAKEFSKPVRQGKRIDEPLGKVTLEPGQYNIRVFAKEITGEELFRLLRISLKPDPKPADAAANEFSTEGFEFKIAKGPYKPQADAFGPLYRCPDWFRDVKFGIYMHWGLNSVPGFHGHYGRNMYTQEEPEAYRIDQQTGRRQSGYKPGAESVYKYHVAHYGHPSHFGYKDFIPLWKAEKFNALALAELYKQSGARFVGVMANHHDNFDLFDSTYQPWNSVRMGPKLDVVGEWKKACRQLGLRFFITSHLSNTVHEHYFYQGRCDTSGPLKGVPYDTVAPENEGLYGKRTPDGLRRLNPEFARSWYLRLKDLIDKYNPDLLYLDGPLPNGDYGLNLAAHFYNRNLELNGSQQGVFTTKQSKPRGFTLDVEAAGIDRLMQTPFLVDTTLNPGWFYLGSSTAKAEHADDAGMGATNKSGANSDELRLTAGQVIDNLADIVSKNGNMMLNVGLRPDGTLPDSFRDELLKIGEWLKINGEAIYGTRPFTVFGEGPFRKPKGGKFDDNRYVFTAQDIRFTTKPNVVYALFLGWPGDAKEAVIESLGSNKLAGINSISMLATGERLKWSQEPNGLRVTMPAACPGKFAWVVKVSLTPQL